MRSISVFEVFDRSRLHNFFFFWRVHNCVCFDLVFIWILV